MQSRRQVVRQVVGPPTPEEVRRNEERFRLMAESVVDYAIFVLDPKGNIMTWNPGAQRMKGYRAQEIIGRHFSVFYTAEDIANGKPDTELEEAARVGRVEDEGRRVRKDGTAFWANVVITALRDEKGVLCGYGKLVCDITERKRADEALQRSEERMRLMLESVVDYAIFMLDPEGNVMSWNGGAQRILGYATEEVVGQHFSRFSLVQDLGEGRPQQEIDAAIAVGRYEEEGWRLRKGGASFWASVVLTALRDEWGELRGLVSVVRDLTERRLARELVRGSEARLLAFMNNSPSVMFIKDVEGRYLHVNQQFVRSFGIEAKQALAHTDAEIFPPETAAQFQANDARVLATGTPIDFEETARYTGGPHTNLVCKFPIFDGAGRVTAVGGIATDISERKRAEDTIKSLVENLHRRTAQLTAVNADLESFSYSMAHDLRAPLRHILAYAEILLEEHSGEVDPAVKRYLDKIRNSAEHMALLVDDLLTLAHLGRQGLERQVTPLNALIDDAVGELKPEWAARQIEWRIGKLPSAECDPALLRQVFLNLLSNALKYTRGRDKAVIEVDQTKVDGELCVFVRDNGVGFDMKYVDKIFAVFKRLHKAEDYAGTGVGLAIVERVIRKHGGRVWAEGEVDRGATFYFRLPSMAL